jgi:site-specific recombinase XerD
MENSILIQKFSDDLKIRHLSAKTITIYRGHLNLFLEYFKNDDITKLSSDKIKRFLISLIDKKYSASFLKGVIGSLQNFYKYTLDIEWNYKNLPRPKLSKNLPTVLSENEICTMIKQTENLKHKTLITVLYTTGVRIAELLNLQIGDIDSQRMQLKVRGGKGNKDRYISLSKACLNLLREYWKKYLPKTWLFEGLKKNQQYSRTSTTIIVKRAAKKAGVTKNICIHTLRHTYATHLLENGIDIVLIKNFLGHSSLKSTMIYLQLRKLPDSDFQHPFDNYLKF